MKKRIFSVLFISVFVAMLGVGIIAPLIPIYADDLGATGIWLGMIFAGFSLSRAIFMPLVGRISDRHGRKVFITGGLLLYALISLLYPFATSPSDLTIIRFFHGFASAMSIPVAMAYIGDISENGREGREFGIFNMSLFLGMGAGPLIGGVINDAYAIETVFYVMAAVTAFAFLISLVFLPETRPAKQEKKKTASFRDVLKNDVMRGMLIFRMINALGMGGVMAFIPLFADSINISATEIGILITSNVFITAALQMPFGALADRVNKLYLVLIGSIITAVSLVAMPFAGTFADLLLYGVVMGLGSAIAMPAATAIIVQIGKNVGGMGASMGVFNMAMSIGMIVAPLLSGAIMDYFGLDWVFFVAGSISIAGTFVFYRFIKNGLTTATPL